MAAVERELQARIAELERENSQLKARVQKLATSDGTEWVLVRGSSWETAHATGSAAASEHARTMENTIASAFRQVKYEMHCAAVDLLGFSVQIGRNRNCTVTPAHFLSEQEPWRIEFIYDASVRRYTDAIWSDRLQPHASLYHYWVLERQCIPGFLAELFLCLHSQLGTPLPRSAVPAP